MRTSVGCTAQSIPDIPWRGETLTKEDTESMSAEAVIFIVNRVASLGCLPALVIASSRQQSDEGLPCFKIRTQQ